MCSLLLYFPVLNVLSIQIGSHFHFIETNSALHFDRGRAYGMRLDILSGTTIYFEPGDSKVVNLCTIAGAKIISGGNGLASGVVDLRRRDEIVKSLVAKGFGHIPEPGAELAIDTEISRHVYVSMYGPTVGDRVRLGHTELWIEVERDEVTQFSAPEENIFNFWAFRPYTAKN